MNERDTELALQAGDYVNKVYTPPVRSKTPGKIWEDGHVGWHAQFNTKFAALIRADAMEAATRAANESWTLMCKKMVGLEREACAKVCEGVNGSAVWFAKQIRARENT